MKNNRGCTLVEPPAVSKKKRSAFTLVELLVVIGIIAILVSLLLPSLIRARQQAEFVQCGSNLRQMYMACLMYTQDYQSFPRYKDYRDTGGPVPQPPATTVPPDFENQGKLGQNGSVSWLLDSLHYASYAVTCCPVEYDVANPTADGAGSDFTPHMHYTPGGATGWGDGMDMSHGVGFVNGKPGPPGATGSGYTYSCTSTVRRFPYSWFGPRPSNDWRYNVDISASSEFIAEVAEPEIQLILLNTLCDKSGNFLVWPSYPFASINRYIIAADQEVHLSDTTFMGTTGHFGYRIIASGGTFNAGSTGYGTGAMRGPEAANVLFSDGSVQEFVATQK